MRAYVIFISLIISVVYTGFAQSAGGTFANARVDIEKLINESKAEVVSVAVYDMETRQTLLINEHVRLHAASTVKLPIMMEIFRLAEAKKINLREPVEVKNKFFSIIDGSEYRLRKSDDSDEEIYNRIGQKIPVIELVNHMITMSSNLATNILVEIAKPEHVTTLMRDLGAKETSVLRGVEDPKAFEVGKNNTTTAYDLMLLLRAIAENKFLNKKACEKMIEILGAQQFNEGVPAGLPTGTKVAHKTGDITKHNHDAAIVYPVGHKPYVLIVLTKGIMEYRRSSKLISEISRIIYRSISQ